MSCSLQELKHDPLCLHGIAAWDSVAELATRVLVELVQCRAKVVQVSKRRLYAPAVKLLKAGMMPDSTCTL